MFHWLCLPGHLYGNGSSRDWAAKGTILLGVKAVVAGSFERIHRSNLIGMGVLPLEFEEGTSWESLGLVGDETVTIDGINEITPRQAVDVQITRANGEKVTAKTISADRYGKRTRLLSQWRHPALRVCGTSPRKSGPAHPIDTSPGVANRCRGFCLWGKAAASLMPHVRYFADLTDFIVNVQPHCLFHRRGDFDRKRYS